MDAASVVAWPPLERARHRRSSEAAGAPPFPGTPAIVDGSEAIASRRDAPHRDRLRLSDHAVDDDGGDLPGRGRQRRDRTCGARRSGSSSPSRSTRRRPPPRAPPSPAARVTNFTAGQGLILMKEVLYVIAGKRLPVVFHVGARALTSQALNIHAGHDDVMGVADTGWGILFARNAQEAADLTAIARRVAEACETPVHRRPGRLPDDPHARVRRACPRTSSSASSSAIRGRPSATWFEPTEALMTGVVQNQDSYMKGRIGQRAFYDRLPAALDEAIGRLGRRSPAGATALIDAVPLRGRRARSSSRWGRSPTRRPRSSTTSAGQGRPVGCVAVTCFRPFPASSSVAVRPQRPIDRRRRADRRTGGGRQPADARGEGGPRTTHAAEGTMVPRVRVGLGRARLPRRRLWRPRRRLRLARQTIACPPMCGTPSLGIRHPLGPPTTPLDLRPPGRVQPSRPLDRRLRLGHDEQARRYARRRPVRPAGPGLPALRLREEGPADDLLPHHRRRSGSGSTSELDAGRSSCRSTTWRRSARAIRCAGWWMAAPSSSNRA